MSTYKHFGKQPDVLKHLVLCEILQNENPSTYVETNSACAIYQMEHTPEQQYGIYHFLERANDERELFRFTGVSNECSKRSKRFHLF